MKVDFYFGGRDWGGLGEFFLSKTLKFNLDFNILLFSSLPYPPSTGPKKEKDKL